MEKEKENRCRCRCTTLAYLTEPVPIYDCHRPVASWQFWVASCQLPVPMADKWSSVDLFVNLYWTGFFSWLFMSFSCILWHFQHMLCHNKKPHLTLFSPLSLSLCSPLCRIINAVILCIFNSITSALPHWKWTSLSHSFCLCVSDRGPSSSCRSLIHFVALCDSLGPSLGFCRVLRLIKRNCFIGEIYIQSIMLAMSPDVSPLGFLIHYAKDLKTSSSLSLSPLSEHHFMLVDSYRTKCLPE